MAWVKGLHIISIVFWSASLIYLPILMAEHNPRLSNPEYLRLHGMVRNLYVWVASPFAILAIITGTTLIPMRDVTAPWFAVKLLFVAVLALIHARCGIILAKQSHSAERAGALSRAMRIASPIFLFPCVLWLVLAKPHLPYFFEASPAPILELHAIENGFTPLSPPPALRTPAFRPAILQPKPAGSPEWKGPVPMETGRQPDRTAA